MVRIPLFLFFFLLTAAGHLSLASWALAAFPALARRRRLVILGAITLAVLAPLCRIVSRVVGSDLAAELLGLATIELMIVVLGAVPLLLVRLAVALAARLAPAAPGDKPSVGAGAPAGLTRRQAVEQIAGLTALGTSTAVLGWGSLRGRHAFRVEEVAVTIPGLPRALDGYTLAQISDIHVGTFVGARELAEGLALVRSVRPDLVVVTGDLVDFDARHAPELGRALADLETRDGVVAILGNHDYYSGAPEVARAVRAAGVELLVNAGRTIRAQDGGGFALLGVDDRWGKRSGGPGPDLARAIAMVRPDAPRVLLAHQPQYFDQVAGNVALQLSGHMHGGQINPGYRFAGLFMDYVAGRYERAGSTLWVNRGFGVAGPPARVMSPPEVTKIVLVAG